MNNYHSLHMIELFAASLGLIALIGVLISSYIREKVPILRNKILKFTFLTIAFLLNIILGIINLLDPINPKIYSIVAPFLLIFTLVFGLFTIRCCGKSSNKTILFWTIFFVFVVLAGMFEYSVFGIDSIVFLLIGLLGEIIFMPIFILDFLIYLIGGKKRISKSIISKKNKRQVFVNSIIVIIILIGILSSTFILIPKQKITSELVIYSWHDYFTDESILEFEKDYGVNVTMYNFGEEPTMEKNIRENPGMYDIVIMSDEYVKKFREGDELQTINKRHIPKIKNIGDKFLDKKYDPKNKYSIPYLWGTTGILLNKNYIYENDTWEIFFDPRYSEKIWTILGPTDTIGVASSYLGYGYVPTKTSQLLKIEQFLDYQKNLLFYEETEGFGMEEFLNETVWASQFYSGDALILIEGNKNLTYVIPKEGSVIWIDNFVILKGSKNKNTAEAFINHILDPVRSASISNYTKFPTTNIEAIKYIDKKLLELEAFSPSQESIDRLAFVTDFDSSEEMKRLKRELWERIR